MWPLVEATSFYWNSDVTIWIDSCISKMSLCEVELAFFTTRRKNEGHVLSNLFRCSQVRHRKAWLHVLVSMKFDLYVPCMTNMIRHIFRFNGRLEDSGTAKRTTARPQLSKDDAKRSCVANMAVAHWNTRVKPVFRMFMGGSLGYLACIQVTLMI